MALYQMSSSSRTDWPLQNGAICYLRYLRCEKSYENEDDNIPSTYPSDC